MKSKKWIFLLLALVLVLSCLVPNTAYAAPISKKQITVYWEGVKFTEEILIDQKGNWCLPLDWMTHYGNLEMKENKNEYEYYYIGEEKLAKFARRIYISKRDRSFSIKVHCPEEYTDEDFVNLISSLSTKELKKLNQSNFKSYEEAFEICGRAIPSSVTLDAGTFSNKVEYEGRVWIPMAELLPLMNVKCDMNVGCLFMQPNTISIWQILYRYNMDDVLFDLEKEFMFSKELSHAAYAVDSLLHPSLLKGSPLFYMEAKTQDYEKVFNNYMVDNEAYLSAFSTNETPFSKYRDTVEKALDEATNIFDYLELGSAWTDKESIEKALGDVGIDLNEFSKGTKVVGEVVQGILWIYEFNKAYTNMVEDHREMLMTVYGFQNERYPDAAVPTWPSYWAAKRISDRYSAEMKGVASTLRRELKMWVLDKTKEYAMESTIPFFQPWNLAVKLTKPFLGDTYDYIRDCALLPHMQNTINIAYDTYTTNLRDRKFDEEAMETIRLSAIMTLVASKHGYTFTAANGGGQEDKDKIEEIQKRLELFYMAADNESAVYAGYCRDEILSYMLQLKALDIDDILEKIEELDKPQESQASTEGKEEKETIGSTENTGGQKPSESGQNTTESKETEVPGSTESVPGTGGSESTVHQITEEEARSCISCQSAGWYCSFDNYEHGAETTIQLDSSYMIRKSSNAPYEVARAVVASITINGTPCEVYQTTDPSNINSILQKSPIEADPSCINIFLVRGHVPGGIFDMDRFGATCTYMISVDVSFTNGQVVRVNYVRDFLSGECGGPLATEPGDYLVP